MNVQDSPSVSSLLQVVWGRRRVTTEIPLFPRVCANQDTGRQILSTWWQAREPFVVCPMTGRARSVIVDGMERILGSVPNRRGWMQATHLLVHEDRARAMDRLWGMTVLGAGSICDEAVVIAASYMGVAVGPLEGPGAEHAQIRFHPLLRLLVRWGAVGAVIEGVEVP